MKKIYTIHTIFIALLLLTLSTYFLSYFNPNNIIILFVLVLTAFIKGYMIISDFMELKDVSLLWKVMMYGWLIIVCVSIIISYLISAH